MEIMRTPASFFAKLSGCVIVSASSVFASDVVLQKVPDTVSAQVSVDRAKSNLSPQASFALINYNLRDVRSKARALYVSSGDEIKQYLTSQT